MTTAVPGARFDVAVLGTHLAGSLLAAVLARHGVRVLLVDAPPDQEEFAGETTVPYTAEVFFTLARRFDIPELAAFGLTSALPSPVRRSSGIKRSLGFVYHRQGHEQEPSQAVQFNVPGEHAEWHLYRPHVDRHAFTLALRYGARAVAHRSPLADVRVGEHEVDVLVRDGSVYHAAFVVDGSGAASPLLRRLDVEDAEPRLRTRSRVLATHMSGVTPFEECVTLTDYRQATPWSKGTLSHLFPGGWLQVVHFDNGEDPVNPLASVVLSVDPVRYADLPADPEEAFRTLIGRFPTLSRSFSGAAAARPWVSSRRWQRTAGRTVGERWFLYDRTASRNDLFLSRDVTMSAEMVHALAPVLIEATRSGDWSAPRLEPVARLQERLVDFNDRLLSAARAASGDFRLWNAYSRVWLLWSMLAALSLKSARNRCLAQGRWDEVELRRDDAFWFAPPKGLRELLERALGELHEAGAGTRSASSAATRIFALLRRAPFVPPVYRFADPRARYYHFSTVRRLRMLLWAKTTAPVEFRTMLTKENLTNVPPPAIH
ncbi:NAD(P)/FAD-dependent oxidoreductase [Nonomuraea sp. NPDC050790]|uniref:NAD(P)/FAD-dependent oxidoreductase n=1 Tax=Nonomuraea sp. NPDC050790 TaxID=3364371 RepID=UPI0037A4A5EA